MAIPLPITDDEGSEAGVEQRVDIPRGVADTLARERLVGETAELVQHTERQETDIDPSGVGEEPEDIGEVIGGDEPVQAYRQVRAVDLEMLECLGVAGRLEHGEEVTRGCEVMRCVRVTRPSGVLIGVESRGGDCHVLTQVRHGRFVRVQPTKPGTFDCNPNYVITRKHDLFAGQ